MPGRQTNLNTSASRDLHGNNVTTAFGLFAVLLVAAVLRLSCLDCRSLWLDEASTATVLQYRSFDAALAYAHGWPDHPPGSFMLTWAFGWLGGTEGPVRLPYALSGLVGVGLLFLLGRRIAGSPAGLAAAGIYAVLPFSVFYAQEARSYVLAMSVGTAILIFAHRVVTKRRVVDWFGLAAMSVVGAYTSFLLFAVIAVAAMLVAADLLVSSLRAPGLREPVRRLAPAAAVGVGAIIVYLPQLPRLFAYLERDDLSAARFPREHVPTVTEALDRMRELDVAGLPAALALVGTLVAAAFVVTGRWREGLLPLLWVGIPLAALLVVYRGGITLVWTRYFAIVYPAFVLLAGLGAWGIGQAAAVGAQRLMRRIGLRGAVGPPASVAVASLIVLVISASAIPGIVAGYERPKGTDYRSAARTIAATGRPSVVLAVGLHPDWVQLGLGHAVWATGVDATIADAARLESAAFARLASDADVWAASYPGTSGGAPADGVEILGFEDMVLARLAAPGSPATAQALTLLRWAASDRPDLLATADLIAALSPDARVGPELLPPPASAMDESGPLPIGRWILQPGGRADDSGAGFVVEPPGSQVDVRVITDGVLGGRQYRLAFETDGEPGAVRRMFVVCLDAAGTWLDIQPGGSGFAATSVGEWAVGGFAFRAPEATVQALVILRTEPGATARFRAISLREVAP